ncbi:hypothetical protein OUZ56_023736 [Daphnia magna]|uniref:Uncharacterized protein n=1 Tax=Daphnia magna TaxID=35525 RepID=A0ABR0B015_9CRUS|nr:hypothetical protein OUZ56_023736 [Daphnia magna]
MSRNGSTLLTEEIELHSFCSRGGIAAGFIESNKLHFIRITETNPMLIWEIFVYNSSLEKFRPQTLSLELNTRSSTDSAAVTTPDIHHGLTHLLSICGGSCFMSCWKSNDSTVPLTEEILN